MGFRGAGAGRGLGRGEAVNGVLVGFGWKIGKEGRGVARRGRVYSMPALL